MAAKRRLVTPPTVEPVTLDEAKRHVQVDHDAFDDDLERMIASARQVCEAWTRRAFILQTWEIAFGYGEAPPRSMRLGRRPVLAVSQVASYDTAGVETVWPASNYMLDEDDTFVVKQAATWPTGTREIRPVVMTYTAGYRADGTDDEKRAAVPSAIRDAILEVVRAQFEREPEKFTRAAKDLLAPFRVYA